MSDFSEDDDEVFIRYEGDKETNNTSDSEEDVAAGRRWDPLGEEKEEDDSKIDYELRHERLVK